MGSVDVMNALHSFKGEEVSARGICGRSASCSLGRVQVDWNHRQDFGWAPIVEACRNSHYDAVELLLNWNIVNTEPDRDGDVPKDHATHPWIIGLLEDRLMFNDGGPLAYIKRARRREQGRALVTLFLTWSPAGAIRDNAGKQPIPRCQTVMYAVHEIEAKFWYSLRSAALWDGAC